MSRFHLPVVVNFSTRVHVASSAITKGTYIQNGFIKQDITPKVYNRPALLESTNQGSTIQFLGICQYYDNGIIGVAYNTGDTTLRLYQMSTYTSTPSSVVTLDTGMTFAYAYIEPIITNGSSYSKYFVMLPGGSTGGGAYSAFHYNVGSSVLTQLKYDGTTDYIPGSLLPGIGQLDGYVFVLGQVSGVYRLANCDLNDATTWSDLNYVLPDFKGGIPVGCDSYKNHIVVFGSKNISFYFDAGNPTGSPLARRNDLIYNFGAHTNSNPGLKTWWKSTEGDILSFIGLAYDGKKFIGLFNDFQVDTISNTYIDGLLDEYNDITICGYSYYGKTFIHLGIGADLNLYYDIEYKTWFVFSSSIAHLVSQPRIVQYAFNKANTQPTVINYCYGSHDSAHAYAGRLFIFNPPENAHTDFENDGNTTHAINLVIQTPRYRGETGVESQRKFQHEFQLIGDTLTSGDTISVQYSDDDYQTFSSARTIDMAQSLKQLNRLGYFRERAFKLTYSGTHQVRLEAIEGQVSVGSN